MRSLLLFLIVTVCTFESDLVSEDQTAGEFLSKLDTVEEHHEKLQRMFKAQSMSRHPLNGLAS